MIYWKLRAKRQRERTDRHRKCERIKLHRRYWPRSVTFGFLVVEYLQELRTTLIPKIAENTDPGQFRQFTAGLTLLRLYHGILGKRIKQHLPISSRQKRFLERRWNFFNSLFFQKCIKKAKTEVENLSMALLDMRKAFDSIGHRALWAACKRLGVPEHLIEYFSRLDWFKLNTDFVLSHMAFADDLVIVSRDQGGPWSQRRAVNANKLCS